MGGRQGWLKLSIAALFPVLVLGSAGCTYLQMGVTYFRHRVEDAADIGDMGITYTEKPSVGLYWNSLDMFPVGYSNLDGWFFGWGGGQVGMTRHYNKCYGFGAAREVIGWGEFDPEDESTLNVRQAGIMGVLIPPHQTTPAYTPACVHFFPHIGYVGFVWNLRYTEIMDFMLGWVGLDIAGDDGYKVARWSFPRRFEPAEEEEEEEEW